MNMRELDFEKYADGLIPAIVQDARTEKVLMLGFMNREALNRTIDTGDVTFFSRSRMKLWTKGETSGNRLRLVSLSPDCDADTLLIRAVPSGPVCHTGADTCFNEANAPGDILHELESIIASRRAAAPESSYTARLFSEGLNKIAQKVGEEAVELVIESKDDDRDRFLNEASDLIFHLLVLFAAKGVKLDDVFEVLASRRR